MPPLVRGLVTACDGIRDFVRTKDSAMALEYVLVTAARNEAAFIEKTLRSMIVQTVLPKRWVIVSDGSTDDTDRIVDRYGREHCWIELVQLAGQGKRSFASKAAAFNLGYQRCRQLSFEVVGNLDADVSFGADYFEFLLEEFERQPRLGVAGTHYVEGDFHSYNDSYIDVRHVNGQCQLFRRSCMEEIGGYRCIEAGGIDWVAVTTARMKGWITYSFGERTFQHHRRMGTAASGELRARFHYGKKDYFLGGHPLWQLCRSVFQMTKRPYVLGGISLLAGYCWCWITRFQRPVPRELIEFHRREQLERLRGVCADWRWFGRR
jgi:glycosyltransferase involved in cell wall biosynthesis